MEAMIKLYPTLTTKAKTSKILNKEVCRMIEAPPDTDSFTVGHWQVVSPISAVKT